MTLDPQGLPSWKPVEKLYKSGSRSLLTPRNDSPVKKYGGWIYLFWRRYAPDCQKETTFPTVDKQTSEIINSIVESQTDASLEVLDVYKEVNDREDVAQSEIDDITISVDLKSTTGPVNNYGAEKMRKGADTTNKTKKNKKK